ncbi:MAG: hypothetical protein COS85_06240 [Armatimonadetes bacterium CG07_land_8_20_14_0_80_59_28]|nr:MAG: hypothetical protein COS85_06240 [Armatimonadetes bacterium CG07_land_8_20_14_0_80_59_28]PIX38379.1 MAG: hypothetical protein COZ56_20665 [Armatimonadetes bacterium CG_4_8_14_3_um_filter_58_9]PIY44705.1 MAG: hypothetical protein COZ05_07425 [Armatimonadetes bacterium CG_4_10_14_3_um_filter_59_10]
MRTFDFTVILTEDPSDDQADRLYSQINDGTLCTIAATPRVHFHREAVTLETALRSALDDVRSAGFGISRIEMEPVDVLQEAA